MKCNQRSHLKACFYGTNRTQLPKRSRTHTTSSSSSAVSFDDGDGNESDANVSKSAGGLVSLSGAGEAEAEAAASQPNDFVPSILGEDASAKVGNKITCFRISVVPSCLEGLFR